MIINVPELKKTIDDYDITFDGGFVLPVVVDKDAGDLIDFYPDRVEIHLVAKPSHNDPAKSLPAEDITVFVSKIASIQHRQREVIEQTKEQKDQWFKDFKELTSGGSTLQ